MATPNADRLRAINDWNPDLIEHTNQTLGKISGRLQTIAEVNRRVAADLGIEGEAAKSASARLDELASSLRRTSTGVDKLVEVQNDFVEGGRQAQDESRAIQANLDSVNSQIDKSKSEARNTPLLGPLIEQAISGQVEQIRDNAHAKIDTHAKEVLATLDARTAAAIGALPKRFAISRIKKAARSAHQREKWAPNKPERQQDSSDRRSSGHSSAPSRSATDWRVSAPPASAGTAGSYSDAGSHSASSSAGGMSLQHSHYTTPQSSALVPGSGTAAFHSSGSSSHSSAVFNPLATSAAVGGGAAVAGYKAYQAARAALAAKAAPTSKASSMRSGAAVRATSPSGSGITRGATTAVRAASPATSVGKAGSVNEGSGGTANRAGGAARGGLAARSTSSTAARTTGSARGATASGAAGRTGGSAAGRSAGSFGGARSAGMGAAGRTGGSGSTGRSASSRAIAGLTGGRRGKDKREDSRSHPIEETQVSLYEDDKTITFLEAGRREETPSDGVPA